jgi:hypothetical protein
MGKKWEGKHETKGFYRDFSAFGSGAVLFDFDHRGKIAGG